MKEIGTYTGYTSNCVWRRCAGCGFENSFEICPECGLLDKEYHFSSGVVREIGRWKVVGYYTVFGFRVFHKYEWEPK
jgi:hypothetical protein